MKILENILNNVFDRTQWFFVFWPEINPNFAFGNNVIVLSGATFQGGWKGIIELLRAKCARGWPGKKFSLSGILYREFGNFLVKTTTS